MKAYSTRATATDVLAVAKQLFPAPLCAAVLAIHCALGCEGAIGNSLQKGDQEASDLAAVGGQGFAGSPSSSVPAVSTTAGTAPPPSAAAFSPAPGAYRRLTNAAFLNSLRDLLRGPVSLDVDALEPDSWAVGGLPSVSAASVAISERGVEQYQTAIDAATGQLFADVARRNTVLGCAPKTVTDTACFQQFITTFGRLAFRQSLTPTQITRYTQLVTDAAATLDDAYEGMRAGMSALLLSPNFLYRSELGVPQASNPKSYWVYTSGEIAARLSYFLIHSTPDPTLLDLADRDALSTADAVRAQGERLLDSPAGRRSLGNFATELFQLQIIGARAKDSTLYPEYTPTLQAAMMQEIPAMFEALVTTGSANALEIFTTRRTFVNATLAALYNLPTAGLSDDVLTPLTLPADGLRAGLLGTAGFLSLYASQKEGSPTQRGKFIRETLLCQTIPPPPPDVTRDLADPPPGVVLTKRERMSQLHLSQSACAGCHALMDPLGFTLENFDAIGKLRSTDQGKPIDASGNFDGTPFQGPIELGETLATQPEVAACLVRNVYRYGTGHVEASGEAQLIAELTTRFRAHGNNLRELLLDVITSDGFRFVAPPEP